MKHLLQHFKTLTKHPKNAEELKGLILQLAVQGKLTENWRQENPNVEPASKLLERIKEEKARLVAEKKIKKEKPLPQIDDNEKFREVPHSWKVERLGNIGDWGAGATPLRSRHDFYGGKINWFKSGELNNAVIDYESSEKITDIALEQTSVRLNKPGDVLIAMYGATIGKTGRLKVYGTTNQAVCACTPFSCITSEYLHLLLKGLKQIFLNQGEGGAQPNISRVKIRNQVFALPPLEEQKAIVVMVNELFAEVEQLEEQTKTRIQLKEDFATSALQRLSQAENVHQEWQWLQTHFTEFFTEKENVKQLRATILQLAVQGKLTQTWRAHHPELVSGSHHASELLKRIQTEKQALIAQKKIKKEKPLPPITEEEIPYELPEGWVWCRLQDIFKDLRYGTSKKCGYKLGVNPVLRIPNLKQGGIDITDLKTTNLSEKELKDLSLAKGDLLIIRSNGSESLVGRSAVISDVGIGYSFAGYLVRLRVFSNHIDSSYLHTVLESSMIRTAIEGPLRTTSGVKNINSTEISKLIIPIPTLEEQKAIVEKVNALMGLCDALEQQVQQSQAHSEQLMQSVLREVFEES